MLLKLSCLHDTLKLCPSVYHVGTDVIFLVERHIRHFPLCFIKGSRSFLIGIVMHSCRCDVLDLVLQMQKPEIPVRIRIVNGKVILFQVKRTDLTPFVVIDEEHFIFPVRFNVCVFLCNLRKNLRCFINDRSLFFCMLCHKLLCKLRHFPVTKGIHIMACVLPVMMKHHHITDRKGMSPKVCRAIYIKAGVNIFKACALL